MKNFILQRWNKINVSNIMTLLSFIFTLSIIILYPVSYHNSIYMSWYCFCILLIGLIIFLILNFIPQLYKYASTILWISNFTATLMLKIWAK